MELNEKSFERLSSDEKHSDEIVRPAISYWADAWRRLKQNPIAMISLTVLVIAILLAIFGPFMVKYKFDAQDYKVLDKGPSAAHWFGTDNLGRDLWARCWVGARVSLYIGCACTFIELVIGCLYGGICGFFGGAVDTILMRVLEVVSSIPYLIVVILLLLVLPKGIPTLIFAMCIVAWTGIARMVRGQIMQLKNSEYVMAAQALGSKPMRTIIKHLLPNTLSIIITWISMDIPGYIFDEAFLSFLGLGVQPPKTSLGALVSTGQGVMTNHPYQLFIPGAIICIIVLAFNVFGDGLTNALDPKLRQ